MQLERTYDFAQVARLNRTVHQLHVDLYPHIFKPYDEHATAHFFQQLMDKEHYAFFLAIVEERIVGYVWVEFKSQPETLFKQASRSLYIHQLSLEPTEQGKGHGKRIMKQLEDSARARNLSVIELDYWVSNEGAAAFYERYGFKKQREFVYKQVE